MPLARTWTCTRQVVPIESCTHLLLTCLFQQKFEFTPEGIAKRAAATVDFWKDVPNIRSPINRAFQQIV